MGTSFVVLFHTDWDEKLPHGNSLQGLPLLAPQGARELSNKAWVRPWSRLTTGPMEVM